MKDNFKNGFIVGMLFMLVGAITISCSVTPLEASNSECGDSQWNPCWVRIVE
jgi:cellobiose-specific phosphotransferase system component IIC|tara:strand:- start:662 stop:817 length:156 start_codon:yes stop_codon:yes gene_type:complete